MGFCLFIQLECSGKLNFYYVFIPLVPKPHLIPMGKKYCRIGYILEEYVAVIFKYVFHEVKSRGRGMLIVCPHLCTT